MKSRDFLQNKTQLRVPQLSSESQLIRFAGPTQTSTSYPLINRSFSRCRKTAPPATPTPNT
jgi:hypothetical protein